MEQRKTLIVTGVVFVLIILIIIGTIIYLVKTVGSRNSATISLPSPEGLIIVSPSPQPYANPSASVVPSNLKTYTGQGFSLHYPTSWGLLTCSNSHNFELDPTNSTDQLNVSCDNAVKPVTVIVGPASCQGEAVKLGNNQVVRSKTQDGADVSYRWCIAGNPNLDITHRVSPSGSRAASSVDYSSQIEQMISQIYFGAGS